MHFFVCAELVTTNDFKEEIWNANLVYFIWNRTCLTEGWCKQRTLGRNKTRNHGESSSENALHHLEKILSFHNGLSLESNLPTFHQSSSPTLQTQDILVNLPLLSCFCRRKRGHQEFLSWTNRWGQRGCRHRDQPNDLPVPAQWTCGLLQREIKGDHYFTCSSTTVISIASTSSGDEPSAL